MEDNRLFVDCDGTLVIWLDEHMNQDRNLWVRDQWVLNTPLIACIEKYLGQHPETSLVVWSGGGEDYASSWAQKCFPKRGYLTTSKLISKKDPIVRPIDICIDDEQLQVSGKLLSPDDFIWSMNEYAQDL